MHYTILALIPIPALGCDYSKNLVDICGQKGLQAFVADALSVPIRSDSCDACISIAVIHHFATAERRLAALCELVRLLRPGGRALIYVWAMEQEYNKQKSKYLKEKTAVRGQMEGMNINAYDGGCQCSVNPSTSTNQAIHPKLPVHTNRTSFDSQDLLVPWHLKGGTKKKAESNKSHQPLLNSANSCEPSPVFCRYYHVFCEGELEQVCKNLECIKIKENYYDQGNWCVVLEKL
uniref:Uncharacterized protein n=1 Tax=Sphaerodactylus townsendi TaxID=933632 RepID=A0ACB8FG60_9SAUR